MWPASVLPFWRFPASSSTVPAANGEPMPLALVLLLVVIALAMVMAFYGERWLNKRDPERNK